ncbi:MAG: PDC sensor domain-containing protein [Nitrosopumilaceae archaeon]
MKQIFKELCEKIVAQDPAVRFVGIADEDGNLQADAERKGLKAVFSPDQRAEYAITAANRQTIRLRWEYLLGKINYATSHYEKLIRATIPIADENRRLSYVVLVSFDANTKVDEIIPKKIIPLIKQSMSALLKEA